MPRTGFLPEPIPTADVPADRLAQEVEAIKASAEISPNTQSPLFKSEKRRVFLRRCKDLSVEQAMAQHAEVFSHGLDNADVHITLDDARALAETIGNDATPGIVEDALADTRLFRRWIKDVITTIAKRHFTDAEGDEPNSLHVLLDVAHIDLPSEDEDSAQLLIDMPTYWDTDTEEHVHKTFFASITWYGRHAVRQAWVDYVMCLMRTICNFHV